MRDGVQLIQNFTIDDHRDDAAVYMEDLLFGNNMTALPSE
jgi:hypothetical protein